ncbi:MAG: thioesterase family protein [Gammaproteobacteria bacterium]
MNLYFRLLLLILKLPFLKRDLNMLTPSILRMHVWPSDLDFNMHMNNGRYLTIMDLGRFHLMAKKGMLKAILKHRWQPVLGGVKIHFIKDLAPFTHFDLKTEVVWWDEKWIYIEQTFLQNQTVIATGLLKVLFIYQGKPLSSEHVLNLMEITPQKPPQPHDLKLWLDAEAESKRYRNKSFESVSTK